MDECTEYNKVYRLEKKKKTKKENKIDGVSPMLSEQFSCFFFRITFVLVCLTDFFNVNLICNRFVWYLCPGPIWSFSLYDIKRYLWRKKNLRLENTARIWVAIHSKCMEWEIWNPVSKFQLISNCTRDGISIYSSGWFGLLHVCLANRKTMCSKFRYETREHMFEIILDWHVWMVFRVKWYFS